MSTTIKKYFLIAFIITLTALAFIFDIKSFFSIEFLKAHYGILKSVINKHFFISALAYFLLYSLVVILSIPVAVFMTVLSGILFGKLLGTFLALISATSGAFIFFLIVKKSCKNQYSAGLPKKIIDLFKKNALLFLLAARLIPTFPFFAINIAAGILQISSTIFLIGTFLGIIPATFLYASLGNAIKNTIEQPDASLSTFLSTETIIILSALGLLVLSPVVYRKIKN